MKTGLERNTQERGGRKKKRDSKKRGGEGEGGEDSVSPLQSGDKHKHKK